MYFFIPYPIALANYPVYVYENVKIQLVNNEQFSLLHFSPQKLHVEFVHLLH